MATAKIAFELVAVAPVRWSFGSKGTTEPSTTSDNGWTSFAKSMIVPALRREGTSWIAKRPRTRF